MENPTKHCRWCYENINRNASVCNICNRNQNLLLGNQPLIALFLGLVALVFTGTQIVLISQNNNREARLNYQLEKEQIAVACADALRQKGLFSILSIALEEGDIVILRDLNDRTLLTEAVEGDTRCSDVDIFELGRTLRVGIAYVDSRN